METFWFGVLFGLALLLYSLPTIVAYNLGRKNTLAIGVLNFFLGWTFIGWLVALIWACMSDN